MMKDRLLTASGAAAALLIIFVLFFQQSQPPPVTRPLSTEPGRNGYLALSQWLQDENVPVVSFRERYTRLLEADVRFPPRGNIMITTMPHAHPIRLRERPAIQAWVGAGNTLLVMAALDDTPEWFQSSAVSAFMSQLEGLSGLTFRRLRGRAADAPRSTSATVERPVELIPSGDHPLKAAVDLLRGLSDGDSELWSAAPTEDGGALLTLAAERRSGVGAVWQVPYFNGQIIVVASASLLGNHLVAESDAARFVANLLQHHLRPGGSVIFDDMHQGLTALYDPAAFYGDPRLHASLLFLLGAWLVYVLGSSNRLAPPESSPKHPRQSDFLAASGNFLARRLGRRDAARMLFDEWFEEIGVRHGLSRGGAPPWEFIESMPALDDDLYRELRSLHERLGRGRSVDLGRLHNILQRARHAIG